MNTQNRRSLWKRSARGCPGFPVSWFLCMSLAIGTGTSTRLLAQSELATLTGTVSDSSGGVIANADVTVKNQGTNISSTGRSNENGRYVVPSLKPGLYTIAVSAPGFKKYVNTALTLQVNQTARLDIELTVGEVTQEVTVSAEAPLLEVDTSGRGSVIDQRKIVELPLNGRDYNQLATLSPGVLTATPRLQSIGFKGVFNVNGNRAFQNAFQLDGVDNTSYSNSFRGGNTQVKSAVSQHQFRNQSRRLHVDGSCFLQRKAQ